MRVQSLWRYPVKSMQGESRHELRIGSHGVVGDRSFGVLELGPRTVISAKREGRLLDASARIAPEGLRVTLPDGREFAPGTGLDDSLSTWLGRAVALIDAASLGAATYERQEDFEDDESPSVQWEGPEGSFVDESALHLLSSAELEQLTRERPELQWDVRRFRPNVVLATEGGAFVTGESGRRVRLGEAEIEIVNNCSRCVMTTRPQPGSLERQLEILRHISRVHGNDVGVRARVILPGTVRVGDFVEVT
jgi:uncharacterized protein YcbX